jgi:GRIM-19 protein
MRWTRPLFASAGPKTPGNFVQDGPPPGGFPAVKIQRSLPAGGLSSVALMSGLVLTFTYGMYQIVAANRQRRQARRAFEAGSALQLLRALLLLLSRLPCIECYLCASQPTDSRVTFAFDAQGVQPRGAGYSHGRAALPDC